jgi:multiple sugar transport system permease protein
VSNGKPARAIVLYTVLTVTAAIVLLPFAWVLFGAFKSQAEIMAAPGAWLPQNFGNFGNFVELFERRQFGTYMTNSIIVSPSPRTCCSARSPAMPSPKYRSRGAVGSSDASLPQ